MQLKLFMFYELARLHLAMAIVNLSICVTPSCGEFPVPMIHFLIASTVGNISIVQGGIACCGSNTDQLVSNYSAPPP